jgi:hypothetical protein
MSAVRNPVTNPVTTPWHGSVPEPFVARLLDEARPLIVARQGFGRPVVLHVSVEVYESLARLRAFDTVRGNPLLVMGAELVRDPTLHGAALTVDVR